MEAKHKVFNLIILDESGSMGAIKRNIIKGFNEIVQTVKGLAKQYPDQQHYVSLVTFNGLGIKTLLKTDEVEKLDQLDEQKYCPDASTPLYDAMGHAIAQLRKLTDHIDDYNVLVTILTDGEENASREYSGTSIRMIVEELKQKNWTFTYIGSNHDVEAFANSISISASLSFDASAEGIDKMFAQDRISRSSYMKKVHLKEGDLDSYFEDTKKSTK